MAGSIDAVLLDAFGTLFAPVSAGSPDAHLCRLLASDGVRIPIDRAGRAIMAEVELYRTRFPYIKSHQELEQLEYAASDLVLAELDLQSFPRDRMRQHLLDLFKLTVYPDAEPALKQLHQRGLALGVVSNYNALLRAHLTELGLADWFTVMVNSAEFGRPKPEPGIFRAAVNQLGITADRVLYVGDDVENDYHGARRAGLQAVLLNRDFVPVAGGIHAVSSLEELPGLVKSYFN